MSADNWAKCPNCVAREDRRAKAVKARVEKSYGKVSAEQYLEMVRESQEAPVIRDTLRENWELGIDDVGTFDVLYRASCNECGFSFSHKRQEKVPLKEKEDR